MNFMIVYFLSSTQFYIGNSEVGPLATTIRRSAMIGNSEGSDFSRMMPVELFELPNGIMHLQVSYLL
jgi:hypothetical protein